MNLRERAATLAQLREVGDALVTSGEASQLLISIGVTRSLATMVTARADGPEFLKIGKRLVRYRVRDLLAWAGVQPA